ncbi:outer membrane protein assembly factor BamD [Luteolibacter algae]|uniref:Outer membrane protein assembly factor BamD n=1 Tax=Luteolibacter algae TaxID=454151 RepID=A0ABW5DDB2_9BACT
MKKCFPLVVAIAAGAGMMVSCSNNDDVMMLAGNTQAASSEGEALYQKAKAADDAGKTTKAIKQYENVADKYPFAPSSAQARFRQAELLEQRGEVQKSFDAYQKFLTRYQGSGLYSTALERQAKMAQGAADGEVKSSFLGLRSKLSTDKVVEMLSKVRDNAPRSATSAKAQFTIGELYQGKKKAKEAIEAYRKLVRDQPESSYAPEALFRVGVVLMEEADRGNRNQATLDLAGEAFQDYLLQYPGHSKNAEARRLSKNLNSRELQRSVEIAEYYDKAGQYESAKIYYREVLRKAGSGAAYDKAKARLKELGE